jgi:putative transposase
MWVEASEDERFCERQVLAQGDQRTQDCGANDILIAMGNGLKGFHEAIILVFPQTTEQTCIDIGSTRIR